MLVTTNNKSRYHGDPAESSQWRRVVYDGVCCGLLLRLNSGLRAERRGDE